MKLTSDGADVSGWQQVASEGEMFSILSGLNLPADHSYDIVLRVVSNAGLTSETIMTSFTVDMLPPTNTGKLFVIFLFVYISMLRFKFYPKSLSCCTDIIIVIVSVSQFH